MCIFIPPRTFASLRRCPYHNVTLFRHAEIETVAHFTMASHLVAHITAVLCCSVVEFSACVLPVLNNCFVKLAYDSSKDIVPKHSKATGEEVS